MLKRGISMKSPQRFVLYNDRVGGGGLKTRSILLLCATDPKISIDLNCGNRKTTAGKILQ